MCRTPPAGLGRIRGHCIHRPLSHGTTNHKVSIYTCICVQPNTSQHEGGGGNKTDRKAGKQRWEGSEWCEEPHSTRVQDRQDAMGQVGLRTSEPRVELNNSKPTHVFYTPKERLSIIKDVNDKTRGSCWVINSVLLQSSNNQEVHKCVELLPWSSPPFTPATVRSHKPSPRRYVLGTDDRG